MTLLDMHMHVWPHGPGTPPPTVQQLEHYCEVATQQGIEQIAITEHSYRFTRILDEVLPLWERQRTGPLADATDHILEVEGGADLDTYIGVLADAQERGLPVLIGLEVDHLAGAGDAMQTVLADYPFDVLLGSVHWLDAWLFDAYDTEAFADEWQTADVDEVYGRYVDHVIELATSGGVDVLAHVDLIKVAGYLPDDLSRHHERLVDGLAGADVAIELSSAGLRKPTAEVYPAPALLDKLIAAGLAVTTTADAHTADMIGRGYDALRPHLRRNNVTSLASFRRRRRIDVPYDPGPPEPTGDYRASHD